MSIPRVKGSGWGPNEKLTHDQITLVDQYVSQRALDKTVAGDTLAGLVVVSSAAGFDFQSGSGPIFRSGSFMSFVSGATVNLTTGISGATIVAASGITWAIGGAMTIGSTLGVTGLATFGAMNVSGAATFSGQLTLSGANKGGPSASRSLERMSKNVMQAEASLDVSQTCKLLGRRERCRRSGARHPARRDVDRRPRRRASVRQRPAGTKNQLKIYLIDILNVATNIGTIATDPTTAGTYAGLHSYLFSAGGGTGLGVVVDRTQYRYFASLLGESRHRRGQRLLPRVDGDLHDDVHGRRRGLTCAAGLLREPSPRGASACSTPCAAARRHRARSGRQRASAMTPSCGRLAEAHSPPRRRRDRRQAHEGLRRDRGQRGGRVRPPSAPRCAASSCASTLATLPASTRSVGSFSSTRTAR